MAWLGQWSPRRRAALRKRRLEAICRRHGCSKKTAENITWEFLS